MRMRSIKMLYATRSIEMHLEDIEIIAPGIANLSQEELEAIQRFTLLWSLFEAQKLDRRASVRKITEKVEQLAINERWFQEYLTYFSERYIENGETNYRFGHLHIRNNDNPERVVNVLTGNNDDIKEQLITCLTIVYRFRNNFFHGEKWAYNLQGQLENFTKSASLLKACLEKMPSGI